MKRFCRKLKSDRGASLVFALLVFMLCVLTGTVALTAASANAGRYTHLEEEQRQYFSVASALELLQGQLDEEFKDDPITVEVRCVETEKWWYVEDPPTLPGEEPTYTLHNEPVDTKLYLGSLGTTQIGYFEYLLLKNCLPTEWWERIKVNWPTAWDSILSEPAFNKTYTISPPTDYTDSLYPVKVTVKNGEDGANYALEMHLTTVGGDAYPLKVVWTADPDIETKTEVETTGDVVPTPANPTDPDSTGTRTTTTTITCTLSWSADDRVITFE